MMNVQGSEPHTEGSRCQLQQSTASPQLVKGIAGHQLACRFKFKKFSWRLVAEESTSSYYCLPVLVVQEIQQ